MRRASIVVILVLAYCSYRLLGSNASLATIGQIAFAAIAQLGPAMVGALFWKAANRRGVFAGLTAGALLWGYLMVLPVVATSLQWSLEAFPGLAWFEQPAGERTLQPTTVGALVSLAGNFCCSPWCRCSRAPGSRNTGRPALHRPVRPARPRNRALLAVKLEDLRLLAPVSSATSAPA